MKKYYLDYNIEVQQYLFVDGSSYRDGRKIVLNGAEVITDLSSKVDPKRPSLLCVSPSVLNPVFLKIKDRFEGTKVGIERAVTEFE